MVALNRKWVIGSTLGLLFLGWLIAVWWSIEPDAIEYAQLRSEPQVTGYATTTAAILITETLLDKPGGFLANDKLPPSVLMDNMPAFEFGALEQVRDLTLVMRKDLSRSQSQSTADPDLQKAQPKFNIDHRSWVIPSAESQYRAGAESLRAYRDRISDPTQPTAQFYARADNLVALLDQVDKRLGSLSQRLSASVGQSRLNTDLAGDSSASSSTMTVSDQIVKTSWWKIDDVFYESRGSCWALLGIMRAVELDFEQVLEKKNATVSLQQIIRELEATQETVWSPMVLNGSGFGIVANHSLVMANYISRANAALIDLKQLLTQG